MSEKVAISKVVLEVGGKKIELTLEEAKALQELLNKTFNDVPTFVPTVPIVIERPYYPSPYGPWTITWCSSDTEDGVLNLCSTK